MLTKLLEIRELFIIFYKRYEIYIIPILKFLTFIIILVKLNGTLGYATVLNKSMINIVLAIILTLLPGSWAILCLGFIIITHLAFASIEVAIVIGLLLAVLYLMFIHLAPKLSYLIIAVPLCFSLNIPYVIPIFAGLFLTPLSVIPIIFGTVIYYFSSFINTLISLKPEDSDLPEIPTIMLEVYKETVNRVFSDKEMIFTVIIFSLVVIITYSISRLSNDYIWYITISIATVVNIILFIIGNLALDLNLGLVGVIFGSILSGIIVAIMQFFKCIVDYSRAEKVQYEDDDYFYYVKAIPKIHISKPKRKVKRIK
ncbi:MAG: hypothetical protein ACLFMO_00745 [Eubacteriales bacterium]